MKRTIYNVKEKKFFEKKGINKKKGRKIQQKKGSRLYDFKSHDFFSKLR